jgi:hypothetical protein
VTEFESCIQCEKNPHEYNSLEQRRGLLESERGKHVEGDGKLKEGSKHDDTDQKSTDVCVVPATTGATGCDL